VKKLVFMRGELIRRPAIVDIFTKLAHSAMLNDVQAATQSMPQLRYHCCLKLVGDDLDPNTITNRLGIEPSYTELAHENSVRQNLWGFLLESEEGQDYNTLILKLVSLLRNVETHFRDVSNRHDCFLACYVVHTSYTITFHLLPETIIALEWLHIPVEFAAYPLQE